MNIEAATCPQTREAGAANLADCFLAAFNAARDGMVVFNDDRRYVAANPAACELLGVDAGELAARRFRDFTLPKWHEEPDSNWSSIRSEGLDEGEYEMVRGDGSLITVEYTAAEAIAPGYHLAILRDVTDRKEREELLERQRRQLVEAQSVAKIGSWEFDLVTGTLEWSDELSRLFEVEPGAVRTLEGARELIHPDDRALLDTVVDTALATHEPFTWECRTLLADGTVRVLESHGRVVVDGDRTLLRMSGTAQDITDRKEARAALVAAHARAVEASRLKSEFMANVSHELRTPLNGVIGVATLLADSDLDDEQREYVRKLKTSGEALLAAVADILDFSKLDAAQMDLEDDLFEPRAVIENVCSLVGEGARGKRIDLTHSADPAVPVVVLGDGTHIRQVLANLVGNAVKFTSEGTVVVHVAADRSSSGPLRLRFEVSDTGIGIEPGLHESIFESFLQADGSSTRRYGGTGLGLTISRQLVTLMGGEIGVRSTPGHGSTFWFTVPVRRAAPEPERSLRPTDEDDSAVAVSPPPARVAEADSAGTGRVLLVEDNDVNRLVATRTLERRGLRVDVAENGREALAMHEKRVYDLIFMDCQMPELDGYDATREIRRREGADRHTPIIAMTASTMPGDRERCLSAGMDYYAPKPMKSSGLDYVITQALGLQVSAR